MITFYTEQPDLSLARYIKHYWYISSEKPLLSTWNNRIFPDTCTDIIFNFGDPFVRGDGDLNGERSFVSGIMQKPDIIGMRGHLEAIGVSFHPGSAFPLLGLPINEIADEIFPLHELWKNQYRYLEERLFQLETVAEKINFLNAFFFDRVKEVNGIDALTELVVQSISGNAGIFSNADLEVKTGISARQIQRKFREQVGLSPSCFARVVRFKSAFKLLACRDNSMVDIALDSGYSDQAHFSREIKAFTGLMPSEIYGKSHADVAFVQDNIISN